MRTALDRQQERHDAYQRYVMHRKAAREGVAAWLARLSRHSVRLDDITEDALSQTRSWRRILPMAKQTTWDWTKLVKSFRRRPRHIELAIWVDHILCGLLVGRISDKRIVATIYFMEGRPLDNPLTGSVARIATQYVETLAYLLRCKQVALDSPLPHLIDFYKKLGYINATFKGKKVIRLLKTLTPVHVEPEVTGGKS